MPEWYHAWGPVRAVLQAEFTRSDIMLILSLAGLDSHGLQVHVRSARYGSKGDLMTAVDAVLTGMDEDERDRLLTITVDEIISRQPDLHTRLEKTLGRLGLAVISGSLVPLDVLDPADLNELPSAVADDLVKAVSRLRDGDPSGAVSAACGAVECVTADVYAAHAIPGHDAASFQQKVTISLRASAALERITTELIATGWAENDAKLLAHNLRSSLNSGAYVMQQLRSKMGDVHGSKPTVRALAFESIKWAEILTRLLASRVDGAT